MNRAVWKSIAAVLADGEWHYIGEIIVDLSRAVSHEKLAKAHARHRTYNDTYLRNKTPGLKTRSELLAFTGAGYLIRARLSKQGKLKIESRGERSQRQLRLVPPIQNGSEERRA